MAWKIELIPMVVNICCTLYYAWKGDEVGKIIYWLGATLLTIGLYKMKG